MELFEKSDILFRFMDLEGFLDMLENDRLLLTVDLETIKHGQYVLGGFFSSFARSTTSTYISEYLDGHGVIAVVDGRKLGQRYRLIPIGWKEEWIENDEMEERFVSDRNVIPNFTKYLIEAYLLISKTIVCRHANTLEKILQLAKTRGVQLKVHIDVTNLSWTYLRNHDETEELVKLLKTCKKQFHSSKSHDFYNDKNHLGAFLDLVQFAEKGGILSKRAVKFLYRNEHVANDENAAEAFLMKWIIRPLIYNRSPGAVAYSEAVKVARLFRNRNPVEFIRKVFEKAEERLGYKNLS